jgi:hypothetical protein
VISTSGHTFEDGTRPIRMQRIAVGDIEIGAGAWIGARAGRAAGVRVGEGRGRRCGSGRRGRRAGALAGGRSAGARRALVVASG